MWIVDRPTHLHIFCAHTHRNDGTGSGRCGSWRLRHCGVCCASGLGSQLATVAAAEVAGAAGTSTSTAIQVIGSGQLD